MRYDKARELLAQGLAIEIPAEVSIKFEEYLGTLPWEVTAVNWKKVSGSVEFNQAGKEPEEVFQWIRTTRIGQHSHVGVWYSQRDGGIIVPLRDGITNLDALYHQAPGIRFCFGVDLRNGVVVPAFGDLLEWGRRDLLFATR